MDQKVIVEHVCRNCLTSEIRLIALRRVFLVSLTVVQAAGAISAETSFMFARFISRPWRAGFAFIGDKRGATMLIVHNPAT